MSTVDVLIIGAGPGGLTAAIALRQHGMRCLVVERVEKDRLCADVGGGYHIGSSTLAMLDRLDAGRQCREAGVRFNALDALSERGRRIRALRFPADLDQVTLRRSILQKTLLAKVADGVLQTGSAVTGVTQDREGVRAMLASGEEISAKLLIGADGVLSKVRESILADGPPRFCGLTCCWGRMNSSAGQAVSIPPQTALTQLGPGATLAATCVGEEIIWTATWRTPSFERSANPAQRKQRLIARFGGWSSPAPQLIEATEPDVIAEVGIWDREPCRSWTSGRVALIGDAAHPMTPFLGQGANSAMLDAFVLADALRCMPHEQAFQAYQDRRKLLTDKNVKTARNYADSTTLEQGWKRPLMLGVMRYLPSAWIVSSMLRADVESDVSDLLG